MSCVSGVSGLICGSSRGLEANFGLVEGDCDVVALETAPPLPLACFRAAARAAFSCALFSWRARIFAFFIALFVGGAGGSLCQV